MALNAFIEPAEDGHLTCKVAVVSITAEVLPEAVRLLSDAGVSFIGSLATSRSEQRLKLVITGDVLPEACIEDEGKYPLEVTPLLVQEERDGVVTTRLAEWRVVEPKPSVIHFYPDEARIRAIVQEELQKHAARERSRVLREVGFPRSVRM